MSQNGKHAQDTKHGPLDNLETANFLDKPSINSKGGKRDHPSAWSIANGFLWICCLMVTSSILAIMMLVTSMLLKVNESEDAEVSFNSSEGIDDTARIYYPYDDFQENLTLFKEQPIESLINNTLKEPVGLEPEQTSKRPWYFEDPPGLDGITKKRVSIWEYEISLRVNASRTDKQRKSPRIAFIKGLKVGSTSVAVALDHVARGYAITTQDRVSEALNRQFNPENTHCNGGSLWYHHGYLNEWLRQCISSARFVTLLREPIAQAISYETMAISRNYYSHYPARPCNQTRMIDVVMGRSREYLESLLKQVEHCVDAPYRKNITLQLIAHAVTTFPKGRSHGFPGTAVMLTAEWITGGTMAYGWMTGKRILNYLRENYFLVGTTEHLNQFLMLLALHMGWNPDQLYYNLCKPTESEIRPEEFAQFFPQLMPKLEKATEPMLEAYLEAKRDFEEHVKNLGTWFQDVVRNFEHGLKEYQRNLRPQDKPYLWRIYYHKDHHGELC